MPPTKPYRRHKSRPIRLLARAMGFMLGLALAADTGAAQQGSTERDDQSLAKAIGAFTKEQALAEDYVGLMKTIGQTRFQDYADGIRLYTTARAEFNSLIEQLKHQLIQHAPPQGYDIDPDCAWGKAEAYWKSIAPKYPAFKPVPGVVYGVSGEVRADTDANCKIADVQKRKAMHVEDTTP